MLTKSLYDLQKLTPNTRTHPDLKRSPHPGMNFGSLKNHKKTRAMNIPRVLFSAHL